MLTPEKLAALRGAEPKNRNRLHEAIRLAGVTQEAIGAAVGLSQPRISAICAGRFGEDGLPLETARDLAGYFGCEIDDLFPVRAAEAVQ